MDIVNLSDQFSTCGQLQASDLEAVRSLGFRALICARPDGEAADQPSFSEIETVARNLGLSTEYIPVSTTGATESNHAAFASALSTLPGPVLAYCRSGQRAAMLWRVQQNATA